MAARPEGELTPVLTADGVRRSFGDTVVLDGVDLTIRPGEVSARCRAMSCSQCSACM